MILITIQSNHTSSNQNTTNHTTNNDNNDYHYD